MTVSKADAAMQKLWIRNEAFKKLEALEEGAESVMHQLDGFHAQWVRDILHETRVKVLNGEYGPQGELLMAEDWGFE